MHELTALYRSEVGAGSEAVPPLTAQFADFAAWQRGVRGASVAQLQLPYWREQLANCATTTELLADKSRAASRAFCGDERPVEIDPAEFSAVLDFARAERVTPFCVMLAAFFCTIWRYTNQTDLVVGVPVAGRSLRQTEAMIGLFASVLPIRAALHPEADFRDLVQKVAQTNLAAQTHADVPLHDLIELSGAPRDASKQALFQLCFAYDNTAAANLNMAGVTATVARVPIGRSRFDLTLFCEPKGNLFSGYVEYDKGLFNAATVDRFIETWKNFLAQSIRLPARKLCDLAWLSPAERDMVLVDWNQTAATLPEQWVHELIEAQVRSTPDGDALWFDGRTLSYKVFNARANRLARRLRVAGVKPGAIVGVCAERSFELLIALLAILKAGGAYLPLDPALPDDRIAFMVGDARPTLVLAQERFIKNLQQNGAECLNLDMIETETSDFADSDLGIVVSADDPIYVIYTSGSTGQPKGVQNTQRGVLNRLCWGQSAYPLGHHDTVLQKTPYSFDVSAWELFWPLIAGAKLVIARPDGHKEPEYLRQLIEDQAITIIHFVPSMLELFLEEMPADTCMSIRRVFCSGEALKPALRTEFFRYFTCSLHNLYGPTEASIEVSYHDCSDDPAASVPIGRPIANTKLYVLDPFLKPVPPGVIGELHIGGIGVATGYVNRPELTAEKFVPDLFATTDDAKMYKTGDRVRFTEDGLIEYVGRVDNQIKLRGVRIEMGEIEAAICAVQSVSQAVVIVKESPVGNQQLVAYYSDQHAISGQVAGSDIQVLIDATLDEIKVRLALRLPGYMIPAVFVRLAALPLNNSGKVDRGVLQRTQLSAALPARDCPPATPLERNLAALWAAVLKQEVAAIEEDFFALGGNSLMVVRLFSGLRNKGLPVPPLANFLQEPTIRGLCRFIEAGSEQVDNGPLVQLRAGTGSGLYLLHPVGGHLMGYRDAVARLNFAGPIYGLQRPELTSEIEVTLQTVPILAQIYAAQIAASQPTGSIRLCGWSMGGLLAYATAQILEGQGRSIGYLGMIDTMLIAQGPATWARSLPENMAVSEAAKRLSSDASAAALGLLTNAAERQLLTDLLSGGSTVAVDQSNLEQLFLANVWAAACFDPSRHVRAIHCYVARQSLCHPAYASSMERLQRLSKSPMIVAEFDGDHHSILAPPMVDQLCACISGHLTE